MRSLARPAVLATFLLILSGGARAAEPPLDLDALAIRAAGEGEVSLYAQGPPQVYADFKAGFEAKYPKLHIRVTGGRYELAGKIDEQMAAGPLDADMIMVQTAQNFVEWRRRGVLMHFIPPGFDTIPAGYKDPDGQFMPMSLYLIGWGYNADKLAAADVPHTVPDFLKAGLSDKIVSTYPHDDDVTLYNYMQIVDKYGWDMIGSLVKQKIKFVRSHVLVAQSLAAGDRAASFDEIVNFSKSRFVAPEDVPMVVFGTTTGIFAQAPHPNAAKLFLSYVISKEMQERLPPTRTWSVRNDVGPLPGFQPLASYRTTTGFVDFVSDEARLKELRAKFEAIIGPAEGAYITTSPAAAPK